MTVLLPARDAAATLGRALDSVFAQTFTDFELVVVDDGSSDDTRALLDTVDDPRLRVVDGPGRGIVAALHAGLAVARSKYVARMDADDTCAPERLALQVAFLDAHVEVAAVSSAFAVIDSDGHELRIEPTLLDDVDLGRELFVRNPIAHGATTIRRAALDTVGGYRDGWSGAEDLDLWRRLREVGALASLPSVLYRWRLTPVDASRAADTARSTARVLDELWSSGPPAVRDRHELRTRAARYASDPGLGTARLDHFVQVELALVVALARRGDRHQALRQLREVLMSGRHALVGAAVFAVSGGRVTSPHRLVAGLRRRVSRWRRARRRR